MAVQVPATPHIHSRPDGSTRISDPDLGYSLDLAPDWTPANLIDIQELVELYGQHRDSIPGVVPIMEPDPSDPRDRIFAILLDDALLSTGAYPTILVSAGPASEASLTASLEPLLAQYAQDYNGVPLAHGVFTNPNAVVYGRIDGEAPLTTSSVRKLTIRQVEIFVEHQDKILVMFFGCEASAYQQLESDFDSVIASLQLYSR